MAGTQPQLFENVTGALLYDTGYPIVMRDRLRAARESIYVTMFYASFDSKKKKSPVNDLVAELAAARRRGVAVRVVLDKDRDGDVYMSRIVNKEAVEFLAGKGVDVRFDSTQSITHSKVVVIDGAHVFIGSHNWTLDSFYKYNETSLYLMSQALAAHYIDQFTSRRS